jgi:uncharacterized protein YjiS (DUF1127 family)
MNAGIRVVVVPGQRKSWLARAAAELKARLDRVRDRQRVFRELDAMSDRELSDLGMSRYDIPRVFDPKFAEERVSGRHPKG